MLEEIDIDHCYNVPLILYGGNVNLLVLFDVYFCIFSVNATEIYGMF